ncbi:type III-D CRISPR-associated RAMP protein Csx10 [Roseiflexus castenholzii]|uniref:type III-D CRISPR-associated RAMP protein Csx10 n=1 Tax=Roseiflexus castenholzii TaxID=120962 RepID=UPI003C7D74A0
MKVIPYCITLLEPLLATRIAGDPNSAVSYPYVPGSTVRGAVVSAYMRRAGIASLDAGSEEVRHLFFDARTRYLHAYPIDARGRRTLPVPRSLFAVKDDETCVYDFAHKVIHELNAEKAQFVAAAKESQPFCWIDGNEMYFIAPQRRINVHTSRDRLMGRATEASGAVFQYDALEEGQTFAGWVLADDDSDGEMLQSLLQDVQRLGGSSNSGYGRVSVEVGDLLDPWRETPGQAQDIAAGQPFIVTLLSDALIRDPATGQNTWDVRFALQALLGVAVEYVQPKEDEERRSVWRMEEVGGFNRVWGLPLQQAHAIVAGSVFVLRAESSISANTIAAAEWQGIGERRVEGFGRLVFDWQRESKLKVIKAPEKPKQMRTLPTLEGPAREMAERIVRRMIRRDLDGRLRKAIYGIRLDNRIPLSNAQISRMRIIVREALPNGDIVRLQRYLEDNIKTRRSVRDQFERTRIGSERLSRWLEDCLKQPESVWDKIGAQNLSKGIGANVRVSTQGNEALAREYTIRLIDGVLARLAKERRREGGE